MGVVASVFGKESVAEPAYQVLAKLPTSEGRPLAYEIRKYGQRFAAEAAYTSSGDNGDMNSPFRDLARYIGVFGSPENQGSKPIAMTAPVMMQNESKGGTPIAMTAPVMMGNNEGINNQRTMKFVLPAEFDSMDKIPKPTNDAVKIVAIPPQVGAVHRFSGSMNEEMHKEIASNFADQLLKDGIEGLSKEHVLQHYQFWGYNPPFCLPMFRRNEVWVELSQKQADQLASKGTTSE